MKIDLTVIIAIILSIIAIISPIISSIINNHYQFKLKRFENYDLTKFKALDNFSHKVGSHISSGSGTTERELLSDLYGLLPYFYIDDNELKQLINCSNKDQFIDETLKLISKLSNQIKPDK